MINTSTTMLMTYQHAKEATGAQMDGHNIEQLLPGHIGKHADEGLVAFGDHGLVGGIGDQGKRLECLDR